MHTHTHTGLRVSYSSPSTPFTSPPKRNAGNVSRRPLRRLLTCQGLDARALKQTRRAIVVVELLIRQVEARVDIAVLLRDLGVVEVSGGRHGGGGRRPAACRGGQEDGRVREE